jgi:hypothetical protein
MLCYSVETSLVATLVIKVSSYIEDERASLVASQYLVFLPPVSCRLPACALRDCTSKGVLQDDKLESRLNMRFRCFFEIVWLPRNLFLKSLQ